jgi:hypothetical protein
MALSLDIPVPHPYNTCMEPESKLKITFVLPRQLIERLRALAKRNRRSLVGELVWAVEQYLKHQEPS